MPRFLFAAASALAIAAVPAVLTAHDHMASKAAASGGDQATRAAAPPALRAWVDGRAGMGKPVHWVADGAVYAYPSGQKMFGMIGLESSTVIWPENAGDPVIHLTRKTFAYTDPDTGEVLTEFNGTPVQPIAYPYQMIHYRLEDDLIFGDVEQGTGERIQLIEAKNGIPYRQFGQSYIFNASVFLDFPLPSGAQYQAWENYDFFFEPDGAVSEPHKMAWQRYGDLPGWAQTGEGSGKAIIQLHSWRVESHDEIPAHIRSWVEAEKPMWLAPPMSVEEVRALQRGEDVSRWGD